MTGAMSPRRGTKPQTATPGARGRARDIVWSLLVSPGLSLAPLVVVSLGASRDLRSDPDAWLEQIAGAALAAPVVSLAVTFAFCLFTKVGAVRTRRLMTASLVTTLLVLALGAFVFVVASASDQ
jgi:hypothetical protein